MCRRNACAKSRSPRAFLAVQVEAIEELLAIGPTHLAAAADGDRSARGGAVHGTVDGTVDGTVVDLCSGKGFFSLVLALAARTLRTLRVACPRLQPYVLEVAALWPYILQVLALEYPRLRVLQHAESAVLVPPQLTTPALKAGSPGSWLRHGTNS